MDFGKVVTAMVTPYNSEKDKVCKKRIHRLVNHLIENGSDGLVVAGTTGESPTISHDEKIKLFKQVVETNQGRAKIIAGTGSNNTAETIAFTKEVEEIGGIDAVLIVAPYYNKPNQAGLYAHFAAIAEATTLPVIIYNIPSRSIVNIEPETIIELSKIENIVAVKESSGNFDNITKIIAETGDDFAVYSGDDSFTLPIYALGGVGVISVASHIIGPEMQTMLRAFNEGDTKKAAQIHGKLVPLMNTLFIAPNPAPVKHMVNKLGVDVGHVRLPLAPLTETEITTIETVFKNYLK
ncbi:4-hydroxy-tetrahydrodipicolinate synthase [Listeria sp. FSL L7-1582]|uniref:4-hydroxy-tetrahydrodipicolinate synthase n=1 Tax=Listeria portnoyi TaxID=2713504 RepID=UPI00164EBA32|nr:4-hydroxy-tetrahydrodipicolinate synthase [Listeria portnoyi]MBC6308002.1 4-hydroxy-tetrahydrodipicolinate synthase [Listeria portnoyi]